MSSLQSKSTCTNFKHSPEDSLIAETSWEIYLNEFLNSTLKFICFQYQSAGHRPYIYFFITQLFLICLVFISFIVSGLHIFLKLPSNNNAPYGLNY